MSIYEHLTTLAGEPVVDWDPSKPDPNHTTYRISLSYDDEGAQWTDRFASFLDAVAAEQITGLVIGAWEEMFEDGASARIVEALVVARDRLPNLRALFFGDIISEECEISWIPADLPALEHLELWLGTPDYGGDTATTDLEPLLSGTCFSRLRYLGLRDSAIADQIAVAIAQAPMLERIRVLDLSLGTLSDEGAAALLASPLIPKLEKLDLHHHFCSDEIVAQFQQLGITVDTSEQEEPDEYNGETWRYVAVGE